MRPLTMRASDTSDLLRFTPADSVVSWDDEHLATHHVGYGILENQLIRHHYSIFLDR